MNKRLSRIIIIAFFFSILLGGGYYAWVNRPRPPLETKFTQEVREEEKTPTISNNQGVDLVEPGNYVLLENPRHVYQTFNNCGPATLSMALSWYGVNVSQQELGTVMRPYQNSQGDNDDKTIFTSEFVKWATNYNMQAVGRVNGDIELLKKFTANGIPVVVKTWLNLNDDIGHFRLIRGFDEEAGVIIQDDSYHGPNIKISYYDFLSMWQPFNYDYMVIYTPEMEDKVNAIMASEANEAIAWKNAFQRAEKEKELDPENVYTYFNIATAAFHLGDYQRSVSEFEKVENSLPRRMLWYQIEPILSYKELGNYDRVFSITDRILNNGNRAFSELYMIRGEIYLERGEGENAREQFEFALQYNENLKEAKEALSNL